MNEVIYECGDFYISYIAQRSADAIAMDEFCHVVGGRPEPKDLPETALVVADDRRLFGRVFYILYGDHRDAYAALAAQGLDACMAYFLSNIEHIGHSSDVPPARDA